MKYIGAVLLVLCMTAIAWAVTPVTKYVSESGMEFNTAAEARHDDELQAVFDNLDEGFPNTNMEIPLAFNGNIIRKKDIAEFILEYYPTLNCNECHKGVTR